MIEVYDDPILWIAGAVFVFSGTVKGLIGIGLPTATIAMLAQFADPRYAIALLMIPMFVANVWQIWRVGGAVRAAVMLWPFALAMMLAMYVAAQFAVRIPAQQIVFVVGCTILVFAASSLMRAPPAIAEHRDRAAQFVAGLLAGVLGGFTAIWSPPMVIYMLARRYDKDDFIRGTAFLIFVGSIPLYAGYWQSGLIDRSLAGVSALMVPPTLIGFAIGEALRRRLATDTFRRAVLVVFALMGLNLVRKGLGF